MPTAATRRGAGGRRRDVYRQPHVVLPPSMRGATWPSCLFRLTPPSSPYLSLPPPPPTYPYLQSVVDRNHLSGFHTFSTYLFMACGCALPLHHTHTTMPARYLHPTPLLILVRVPVPLPPCTWRSIHCAMRFFNTVHYSSATYRLFGHFKRFNAWASLAGQQPASDGDAALNNCADAPAGLASQTVPCLYRFCRYTHTTSPSTAAAQYHRLLFSCHALDERAIYQIH